MDPLLHTTIRMTTRESAIHNLQLRFIRPLSVAEMSIILLIY